MCGFKNYRTWLVEIVVNGIASPGNGQTNIQFVDQPYLRYMPILWLETYSGNDIPVSPQGNTVITIEQMQSAFLTLYTTDPNSQFNDGKGASSQGQWIQNIPLIDLHQIQNGTDPFNREKFLLNGQTIIWEKSFINLAAPLNNTTNYSFLINVGFANGFVSSTNIPAT